MAEPFYRVTIFWHQDADLDTGFSENFWNQLTDFDTVKSAADRLRDAINAFKGTGTRPKATRIAATGTFRVAQLFRHNYELPETPNAPEFSDFPDTAVLMKLFGPQKIVVNQWLRGLREAQVNTQTGGLSFRTTDTNKFNAIRQQLLNGSNGWCLRVRDPVHELKDIRSITTNGVVEVKTHGYADGNTVRISRVKGMTYANNLWKIIVLTPDTFQLIGWQVALVDGAYLGGGKCRKIEYTSVSITDVKADRATRHESGRPFGLRGGRRKKRKT